MFICSRNVMFIFPVMKVCTELYLSPPPDLNLGSIDSFVYPGKIYDRDA